VIKDSLGLNLRGFGLALDQLTSPGVLRVHDLSLYFHPPVARSFARLVAGDWNEPESHKFLRDVLKLIPESVVFVDVGANVGEMVLDMARHPKVDKILAFEPNPECVYSLQGSLELNGFDGVTLFMSACGSVTEDASFRVGADPSTGSLTREPAFGDSDTRVEVTMLDAHLMHIGKPALLLIDVEGHELEVLKGGRNFVAENHPLIVFEYHGETRKFFSLGDVKDVLGDGYVLRRLTRNGRLSEDLRGAWNMVALPLDGPFREVLAGLPEEHT